MTYTALVKVFPVNTNRSITNGKIFVFFGGYFAQGSRRRQSRFRYPLLKEKINYFKTLDFFTRKNMKPTFSSNNMKDTAPTLTQDIMTLKS